MFRFPFGTIQELNLDWFLEQWEIFKQEAQTALDGIDHALDDEIQRVEDAMTDLYAARDAAIAAKNDALDYAQSANSSAIGASQSAQNSAASAVTSAQQAQSATQQAQSAAQSATSAQSSATNAGTSAGNALAQAQESEAWATGEIGGVHVPPTAPQNLSNAKQYAMNAGLSANAANTAKNDARVYSQDSKAWATGIRNGQPVTSEDETYQNNAKYYAESIAGDAAAAAQSASAAAASAASVNQSAAQIAQNTTDIANLPGRYWGAITGTTLASNNKIGSYNVGGFNAPPTSDMTDMPVSDFAGGYLINSAVGRAGTTIRQELIENPITTKKQGRRFVRIGAGEWFGIGPINWVAYGDSITHGSYSTPDGQTLNSPSYSYAFRIANSIKRDRVNTLYNCGVRGIGWVNTGNNGETLDDMFQLYTGDKTIISLVTVMLGINDYLSLEIIGDENSAEKDGTISGNVRYGIRWLCENYPNAKIVIISPLNSTAHGNTSTAWSRNLRLNNPHTLQDVCNIISYWCDVYCVKFVNELSEGFINVGNATTILGDEIHPTDNGQWLLAFDLAEKIGF